MPWDNAQSDNVELPLKPLHSPETRGPTPTEDQPKLFRHRSKCFQQRQNTCQMVPTFSDNSEILGVRLSFSLRIRPYHLTLETLAIDARSGFHVRS